MKSRKEENIKRKNTSSNKINKRKKLSTKSPVKKSKDSASADTDSCPTDTKPEIESVVENDENNKQTESVNSVKIKSKRGRKSNKDRLQLNSLNLGRKQNDLQTFVQRKIQESKESKVDINVSQVVSKEEENSFSGNHIKTKKNKHKKLKNHEDTKDEVNIFNSTSDIVNENLEKTVLTEQKNAFKVMMESRNKVIGRNSPGKDVEIKEANDSIAVNKLKRSARKALLQEWASAKGGLKRKMDEVEKQLCINEKLEMRAKRMKNMLSLSLNNKNKDSVTVSKRRKVRKIVSDSENSSDEELSKNVIHISEDSEHYESDTERQTNVIKIKMFSPEVFKRRRRNKQDNLKNSKKIIDNKADKNNDSVDEDHEIKVTTNTASVLKGDSNDEKTNLRRSSRKSTKINYHNSDLIFLSSETEEFSDSYTIDKPKNNECRKSKETKVAPVFLRATPKPKIDPAIIEARKQFLMSGVPDSLKRVIEKQQTLNDVEYDVFPTISHVQQKTSNEQNLINYWSLPPANLNFIENVPFSHNMKEIGLLSLLNYTHDNHKQILENSVTEMKDYKSILKDIKLKHPDYPVFKTYRLLREKFELCHAISYSEEQSIKKKQNHQRKCQQLYDKEDKNEGDYILWTEKFKPKTSYDIVGNQAGTLELKKWLISWVEYSPEAKLQKTNNSSSSDFDSSDGESSYRRKIPNNAIILIGPHGSGKTMTIYALCNELHINVLELSASDKRTGKRLLQKLQEATQSHQVRKTESANSSQHDSNQKKEKMCLLVVDDIDVIFDQDEGFLFALTQLLQTSKRPIVLVTTDENCSHLQKFIAQYRVIKFTGLSANVLSVWLQILCVIEGIKIDEEVVGELLERNKGDARKTLLQLQFWLQNSDRKPLTLRSSAENLDGKNVNNHEKSNCSYLNDTPENCLQEIVVHSSHRQFFVNETLTLENVWWNLSSLLNTSPISHNFYNCDDKTEKKDEAFYKIHKCKKVFSTFALSDFIYTKLNIDCSAEPSPKIFQGNIIKDSMELIENVNTYSDSKEVIGDWTSYLLSKQLEMHGESQNKLTYLTSQERRWRSKQYNCERKFLELVSSSYHTDRKAFSLDYFPALRTVARSEKQRAITNCKRGNRFYNYLSTLGFSHKEAITQTACDILNINKARK